MHRKLLLVFFYFISVPGYAQEGVTLAVKVLDQQGKSLPKTTIELLRASDSSLVKINATDTGGLVEFMNLSPGEYFTRISRIGYALYSSPAFRVASQTRFELPVIRLQRMDHRMEDVTITTHRTFIEMKPGKTIVNLEASITSAGITVLEALEKMPGITIDKDGNISLKGKQGVMIMLDGKPTYLSGTEIATLLGGMSSSQVSQVEIMDTPPSRYDAAGNAGVINIKTKKNRQHGFNANITLSYAQGVYPKGNNSILINFRSGKWNFFTNYSNNLSRNFTRIYALRRYFDASNGSLLSSLEQPSIIRSRGYSHVIRSGVDYDISAKTSIGITVSFIQLERKNAGNNTALWMDHTGKTDSLIETRSYNHTDWKNGGLNLYLRHSFTPSRELTADLDVIGYRIRGSQDFENNRITPGYYHEAFRADIPSHIRIISGKADYSQQLKNWKLEGGWKTSHIETDNLAAYEYIDGGIWRPDPGRSNHFLYTENIHAFYGSTEAQLKKWSLQGGLRYETTSYDGHQLGNTVVKDSLFSRNYHSLFPSFFASYAADSNHSFSFTAGRRIDRPGFQKLNPFLFIINKYTYQQGNPFFKPQYTWNFELGHVYREKLITGLSYSITNDYFAQIFPIDTNGIVLYTEGNLKRMQVFGLSLGVQLNPAKWWQLSAQAVLNHKRMEGLLWKAYTARITQVNFTMNNTFRFGKGWGGELSGFYTSRSQHDIQEIVEPAGQLSAGLSKTALKNKATVKLSVRDIFYTNWMKGITQFQQADEYFRLTRDTRTINLAIVYRFGKAFTPKKRSSGASGDEIQRVGNG